jgi:hypothetical protein
MPFSAPMPSHVPQREIHHRVSLSTPRSSTIFGLLRSLNAPGSEEDALFLDPSFDVADQGQFQMKI